MVSLRGQRAYLDANTIIYALEGFAQYSNLKSGLLIPLDTGEFTAVTSEITLVETVVGPRKAGKAKKEAELVLDHSWGQASSCSGTTSLR
jgi:predicted nucleic acid-binding protein